MSLAQTAILATAIRPRGEKAARPAPSSIKESVAQKPIQWLVVGGVVAYVAYKLIDKAIISGKEQDIITAETKSSSDNPFQFAYFLQNNIPKKGTNVYNSSASYKAAKQIYDELNSFFNDNDDVIIGVFQSCSSKYKVAQVAQAFNQYYKRDILTFLRDGKKTFDFGTGGISDENYQKIITMVNKKPLY
jgi:hypothetical protein